jgi:phosphatidylserine decarboxylase
MLVLLLSCLIVFYRYEPYEKRYENNVIISPAEGTVSYLKQSGDRIHVSIYLNFLTKHYQICPVNGVIVKRIYDNIGTFSLANNHRKSRFNEKKIHSIQMENGKILKVTQIAGFFARRIVSSDNTPEEVLAGEYFGMIKLGSRVDLEFEGDISNIKIKDGQKIHIGDEVYTY